MPPPLRLAGALAKSPRPPVTVVPQIVYPWQRRVGRGYYIFLFSIVKKTVLHKDLTYI